MNKPVTAIHPADSTQDEITVVPKTPQSDSPQPNQEAGPNADEHPLNTWENEGGNCN